ncbi:hypothetical protein QYE76_003953 [Lolium multiflorum]|uniref:C2H2-type domain-containing protein n=1 Tax=Lolium multiflorum TaxID=4521 RepID=A0AAD8RPQ8_LOLMU|nr:hypothetical protein QYE76_003953 [Lolium multiflorum]
MESTAPAAAAPLAAVETTLVIRDEGNKVAKRSSTSCLAPSSASNKNKKLKEPAAPAPAGDTALQPLAAIRDKGKTAAKKRSRSSPAASSTSNKNKKLKEPAAPAPAADTALQPLAAIREEGKTAAKKRSRSSPAASSTSNKNKKLKETIQGFTCEQCDRNFVTEPAMKQHQTKTHTNRDVGQEPKEPRRLAPAVPQVSASSSLIPLLGRPNHFYLEGKTFELTGSGLVPVFFGPAPAQPSTGGGGQVGSGDHLGSLREVNQGGIANGIHNFPLLRLTSIMPMFPGTGSGTSSLPGPSCAALTPVADGNGRTGDGDDLGSLREVDREGIVDGIDLTLRL